MNITNQKSIFSLLFLCMSLTLYGADIEKSKLGVTPLHKAASDSLDKVITELYKIPKVQWINYINERDNVQRTALHRAAMGGKLEIVKFLVEQGAVVSVPDYSGLTPLHDTINTNDQNYEIATFLIDNGADLDIKGGYYKVTPLKMAANGFNPKITRAILAKNPYAINNYDHRGNTLLHYAVYGNSPNIEVIKILLEFGADIYKPNKEGKTALNLARTQETRSLIYQLYHKRKSQDESCCIL